MIRPGDTITNPVTGERFTFTNVREDLLAFDFALAPGGKVPIPHVHPIQTERFEVVSGASAKSNASSSPSVDAAVWVNVKRSPVTGLLIVSPGRIMTRPRRPP